MTMALAVVEELWAAYRDFVPRYTPLSIRQDYERRLLEAVPWLIERVRERET
jgi:hypothetical protein